MGLIDKLVKFTPGTKAVSKDINDNFESLRQGNNDSYTLLNDIDSKVDNMSIVNVKDYGAIGNGIHDDTEAIKKAIHAVSPVCTSYDSNCLADFVPVTDSFSTSNAYRYGGIVILPRGTYLVTDTIYLNQGVLLAGEGRVSNGFYNLNSPTGTIISFQPDIVTDKIAIDISGFDKATGQRILSDSANIVKSWAHYDQGLISSVRGAGLKDLSVVCKDGVTAAVRLTGASASHLNNVAIQGTARAAIVMSASLCGSFTDTHGNSSTQGIVAFGINSWKLIGECYFNSSGNKGTPVYTYPDFGGYDKDQFASYSTGFYGAYLNAFDTSALCMEHWDRAFFMAHAYGCSINQLYLESIKSLLFNFVQSSVSIANPFINCPTADAFCLQNIQNVSQPYRQIRLNGLGYGTFNKFISESSGNNETNALLVDIPDYYLNTYLSGLNATYYSWVTFENVLRNSTYAIYVDSLKGNDANWGYTVGGAVASIKAAIARCRTDKLNVIYFLNGEKHYTNTLSTDVFTNMRLLFQGYGTMSGITGSIASGSSILTVNNASNFSVNRYINIAGAGAGGSVLSSYVTAVNGNLVTLNNTASTTVTDAAISYQRASIVSLWATGGIGKYVGFKDCDLRIESLDLTVDSGLTTYPVLFNLYGHNKIHLQGVNVSMPVNCGLFTTIGGYASTLLVSFSSCNVSGAGYIGLDCGGYNKCAVIGNKYEYGGNYTISNNFATTRFTVVSYV